MIEHMDLGPEGSPNLRTMFSFVQSQHVKSCLGREILLKISPGRCISHFPELVTVHKVAQGTFDKLEQRLLV